MEPVLLNEIQDVLTSIERHKFTHPRQVNPQSALFQAIVAAEHEGFITGSRIDTTYSKTLATFDLTKSSVTDKGQAMLTQYAKVKEQPDAD